MICESSIWEYTIAYNHLCSLGRSSGSGTFGIQTIDLKGITFADNWKPQGAPSSVAGQSVVTVGAGEHTYCR